MNFKIKTKILMLVLGVSLLSLILFLIMSYSGMMQQGDYALNQTSKLGRQAAEESREALEEQTERDLMNLVISQARSSNDFFAKIEEEVLVMSNFSYLAWENEDIFAKLDLAKLDDTELTALKRIAPGVARAEVESEINALNYLGPLFKPHLARNENLDSIFFGTEKGLNFMWPDSEGDVDASFDPRERPWYQDAVESTGISWTDPFEAATTGDLLLASSHPVFTNDNQLKGVVGATVTLEEMLTVISDQVEDLGYAILLDSQGEFIASPGLDTANNIDIEALVNKEEFSDLLSRMPEDETRLIRDEFLARDWFIGYAPIKAPDWKLVIFVPEKQALEIADNTEGLIMSALSDVEAGINQMALAVQRNIIFVFVALLLLIILVANYLANRLSKPIKELERAVFEVGDGDLDYNLSINTGDEIEELASSFNQMTQDLKQYMKELKETTAIKEKIESELQIATNIQASMLPRTFPPYPKREEFDVYASMQPAKEVGGDFYDFFMIDEHKFGFVIGDVSGKGVPAALFMVIAKTLIKNEALRGIPAEQILKNANNALAEGNDELLFVTCFVAILDLKEERLEFSNAGHNPALIYHDQTDECEYLKAETGFVLGTMPDFEYKREEIEFNPGDIIYLYTDGITEAMNEANEQYGEARLRQNFLKIKDLEVEAIEASIKSSVKEFAGDAIQHDDITMLLTKFKKKIK